MHTWLVADVPWVAEGLRVLGGAVVGGGGLAVVLFLCREWLTQRLSHAIKHEYDVRLEREKTALASEAERRIQQLRAEVEQRMAVQGVAATALNTMHSASSTRRLQAIESLWATVLKIRDGLPAIVAIYESVNGRMNRDGAREVFKDCVADTAPVACLRRLANLSSAAEQQRPFAGERLWAMFTAYRVLWTLSVVRFRAWWDQDESIVSIIDVPSAAALVREVLSEDDVQTLSREPNAGMALRTAIEQQFVSVAYRVASGEASADLGLEQAKRIALAATAAVRMGAPELGGGLAVAEHVPPAPQPQDC